MQSDERSHEPQQDTDIAQRDRRLTPVMKQCRFHVRETGLRGGQITGRPSTAESLHGIASHNSAIGGLSLRDASARNRVKRAAIRIHDTCGNARCSLTFKTT